MTNSPFSLVFSGAGLTPIQYVLIAVLGLFALVFLFVFARLFRVWLMGVTARADISVMHLIGMMLRRTPPERIVKLKVMVVQSSLPVSTAQIEAAYLCGADVERALLALIRARDIGKEITWEEAISQDASEGLRKKLFDE